MGISGKIMGIYGDTLPGYLSNIAIENGDLVR